MLGITNGGVTGMRTAQIFSSGARHSMTRREHIQDAALKCCAVTRVTDCAQLAFQCDTFQRRVVQGTCLGRWSLEIGMTFKVLSSMMNSGFWWCPSIAENTRPLVVDLLSSQRCRNNDRPMLRQAA